MSRDISGVPKKWDRETIVYDKTYRWMLYKPNRERTLSVEPCSECARTFYGSDGKTVLTLHKIIHHTKEVKVVG